MQEVTGSTNPTADPINASEGHPHGSAFLDDLVKKITSVWDDAVEDAWEGIDMPGLRLRADNYTAVCQWLRDAPGLRYALLSDLTCVDFLDRAPRFDVVCHLYSFERHTYLRVKVGVPEEPAECPSLTGVWPGANWLEREVWDMFGIRFSGHPNLTRILTPDGWEYFALRRDFPLQGPGMIKLFDSVSDVF